MTIPLAFIAGLGFLLRVWPRAGIFFPTASDTHFHLFFAAEIQSNRHRIPKVFDRIIVPHRADYPCLYHWMLSFFTGPSRLWAERLSGPLADTLILLLIPSISFQMGLTDEPKILASCILFACYPALFRGSSGPRIFSGCPRVLGQLFYLVHLILFAQFLSSGDLLLLGFSIVFGALLLGLAKFGTQVYLFFSPFLVFHDARYCIVLILSFALASAIGGATFWRTLQGHWEHSEFYFYHLQKDFLWPKRVSASEYSRKLMSAIKHSIIGCSLKPLLNYIFQTRQPINTLLFIFPLHLIVADRFVALPITVWSYAYLASLVLFVITSFKHLLFIGESERYLEYTLAPTLIVFTVMTDNRIMMAIVPVAVAICAWIGATYRKGNVQRSRDLIQLSRAMKTLPESVLWPVGSFHHTSLLLSGPQTKVVSFGANLSSSVIGIETYKLIYENAPYPSKEWQKIVELFRVTHILTDNAHHEHYKTIITDEDVFEQKFKEVLSTGSGLKLLELIRN